MTKDNQDEIVRLLKRSSFDEVYKEISEKITLQTFQAHIPMIVNEILDKHGWTGVEFRKELIGAIPLLF